MIGYVAAVGPVHAFWLDSTNGLSSAYDGARGGQRAEPGVYYPPFHVPHVGGGMLIAVVAILHVVVSHFAVGAGLFTAVLHTLAVRRGGGAGAERDPGDETLTPALRASSSGALSLEGRGNMHPANEANTPVSDAALILRFLHDNSRFLVLLSFVFGAISGVGIWFTIALVSPRGTSILIHNFVWGWAIEWVLFAVEIVAGYCYYYGWDRLSPARHHAVAWIYAIASYGSLVVINGILSFMLTPGAWLEHVAAGQYDAAFWSGFFNPTYLPSLLLRTLSCLALAGLFVCVVVNLSPRYDRAERTRIINYGAYCLAPFALMAPASLWYFNNVPEASRVMAGGGAIAMTLFLAFGFVCSILIGAYAYIALIRRKQYVSLSTAMLLAAMALVTTGAMEFVREGIRKPYVIRDYLWSNGIADRPDEYAPIAKAGALTAAPWIVGDTNLATAGRKKRGELIFMAQCAACHTVDGVNGIRPLVAYGRDIIRDDIEHLHERKSFMPPFIGTAKDKDDLAAYLFSLNNVTHRPRPGLDAKEAAR